MLIKGQTSAHQGKKLFSTFCHRYCKSSLWKNQPCSCGFLNGTFHYYLSTTAECVSTKPLKSVQGDLWWPLLPLNRMHSRNRIKSFKESGHQIEDLILLPCSSVFHSHTKSTFTPSTFQQPPTLLIQFLASFCSSNLRPFPPSLRLHITFLPFLWTPPLIPCHSISFVHSSFIPCCFSSHPPSSCSPGVCGSDNEVHS